MLRPVSPVLAGSGPRAECSPLSLWLRPRAEGLCVAPCGVERDAGRGSDFVRAVGRVAGPVDADESLQGTGPFVGELTRRVCWCTAEGGQAAAKGVLHVLGGTGQRRRGRSLGHRGVRAGPTQDVDVASSGRVRARGTRWAVGDACGETWRLPAVRRGAASGSVSDKWPVLGGCTGRHLSPVWEHEVGAPTSDESPAARLSPGPTGL